MKNYIDEMFYKLMKEFKDKSYNQIYQNMVDKFLSLDEKTKDSIEKFLNQFNYWGRLDRRKNNYEVFSLKANVFKNGYRDFIWLYNKLNDYQSKFVLFSVLSNYYNFDFGHLASAQCKMFKQYFDLDLMKDCKDKVFVDVGSYVGDSVFDFIFSFGDYKKIYCYEITQSIINLSKTRLLTYQNIIFKNMAVSDKNSTLYLDDSIGSFSANKTSKKGKIKITSVSLDNDILEKIDIIKMDIEGGEKKALIGAKKHIIEDNPILLVAVYHSNIDLIKLPRLINRLNKNYNFYLRYSGGSIYATEIDLICLPE